MHANIGIMQEKLLDQVYDTDYTAVIRHGGMPKIDRSTVKHSDKKSRLDRFIGFFVKVQQKDTVSKQNTQESLLKNKSLEEQLKYILAIDDDKYEEKLLTPELRKYILAIEKDYVATLADYKAHLAPSHWEIKPGHFNVSGILGKTYYATSYPSYIDFLRTRDMLGYYAKRDMSRFIYPTDDGAIKSMLKRRATQLRAEINTNIQKGITLDSEVDIEYRDVENVRQKLATREERYFETSFYTTIYEHDQEKLREESKKFEQKIS